MILFKNASEVITNKGVRKKNGVGIVADDLGIIEDGALAYDQKKGIVWMGPSRAIPKEVSKKTKKTISLKGKILSPALADCHTHLVFAGSRHNEFSLRLEGKSYSEIASQGGGIQSSVEATKAASEVELFKLGVQRINQARGLGVGLLEIKSGYGLDWITERKILKVIQKLKTTYKKSVIIQSTFLGAHAFPKDCNNEALRCGYVDNLVDKMLNQVAKEKLSDACDVFMDEGYFDYNQSKRILSKAKSLGLKIKLHADELKDTGAAALAAELQVLSADHLLKANDDGLKKMAASGVVGVLLPTTAFYLGIKYADIGKFRKHGVCIALATDFNPGSSPCNHLPFVMTLACAQMGLTMPEAFAATTYGGARALGYSEGHGFLEIGYKPKIAVFNLPSYQALIQQVALPESCGLIL